MGRKTLGIALLISALLGTTLPAFGGPVMGRPQPGQPEVDRSLTLTRLVEQTYGRLQEQDLVDALAAQTKALQRLGNAWFGEAPTAYGSYRSDQMHKNTGTVEGEVGLNLTLPNWGQRSAAKQMANEAAQVQTARSQALLLEVAGLVREAMWNLRLTQNRFHFAETALAASRKLHVAVERRVAKGDLARSNLALAKADVLQKEGEYSRSRALVHQAGSTYRNLTGHDRLPADAAETQSSVDSITPEHPVLAAARAQYGLASASLEWTRAKGAGNPVLGFGIRRERQDRDQPYADSAVITLSIPLGTGAYAARGIAEAHLASSEALMQYRRVKRQLELGLTHARENLLADRAELGAARERARLATQYLNMNRKAFASGEIDLFTLLRIQSETQAASLDATQRAILLNRDTARYNQASGVFP